MSGSPDTLGQTVTVGSLSDAHREVLIRAVTNVVSSGIAEATFAQIVDGLPLSEVDRDTYNGTASTSHPLHTMHMELCPGVLDTTRQLIGDFDANSLRFDAGLCHAYQAAAPGSRAFKIWLVELVAIAVHQIAVRLYAVSITSSPHKDGGIGSWTAPEDDAVWWEAFPDRPPPTLFRHEWYCDYDQYPDGVADGVGYWAEARIFGGVVLFDRREPGLAPDVDPEAVYLHPDRHEVTYRIYKLLDAQKLALVTFLLSGATPEAACPLPILGDAENRQRVDPEEPIAETGIYRDLWERRPWPDEAWDVRLRDVFDPLNWTTMEAWCASAARGMDRRRRIQEREWEGEGDGA